MHNSSGLPSTPASVNGMVPHRCLAFTKSQTQISILYLQSHIKMQEKENGPNPSTILKNDLIPINLLSHMLTVVQPRADTSSCKKKKKSEL